MALGIRLHLVCCSLICLWLWTVAHSLAPDSDGSPSSSAGGGTPDVRVTVSVSEHFVTLSCDVAGTRAGADDHKVQFFCPVLPGDVQCYGDCSPICTMQIDGSCRVIDPILESSESIACQKVVSPSRDAKSVRLRVDTRQARLAGQWRCKFRGTSSATVSLARHVPADPTPAAAAAEATAGAPEPAAFTDEPHQVRATAASSEHQSGLGVWKPDIKKYPGDFAPTQGFARDPNLARFARTDYIIGVLTIMSVSLLLNLGFCIRCILARHYVETRKRNHRQPLGWLGSCLCVSTVQVMLDADSDDRGDADEAAASGSDPAKQKRSRLRGDDGAGDESRQQLQRQRLLLQHQQQQQLQQQQQQQPCLYCMQSDCRILYDDVARSGSECGSSCRGGGGGGSSFRLAYEGHVGRGSLLGVPAVPEEAAAAPAAADEAATEPQGDAEAEFAASDPGTRLELSRRMLRKADTLLREANSLLLETESTTEQQTEQ